jgi:hypothetical protein
MMKALSSGLEMFSFAGFGIGRVSMAEEEASWLR